MADGKERKRTRQSENPETTDKRFRAESPDGSSVAGSSQVLAAGKIKRICVRNFMCHDALEIVLNPNVNFIIGRNGSGKSAILTALTVGLGARAHITNRGASVKEFIKKGKNSASIEVTIVNDGPTSFKPEIYGKTITVCRTIGSASTYRLKNAAGKTVSQKRDELERMLNTMNIQVENPISVLNQDVSRTFLTSSSAEDKYTLLMKATQMDVASNSYKEALQDAEDTRRRLNDAQTKLNESKREVVALEKSMEMLESVETCREEVRQYEVELCWAKVIEEESKLREIEQNLAQHQTALKDIEAAENMKVSKEEEIQTKIDEFKAKIREIESEASESMNEYSTANERYHAAKDSYSNKKRELMSAQGKIQRTERDIGMINNEINRIQSTQGGANERALKKEEAATKKQELDEIEAMFRTKQNEQMHFSSDKVRLEQEEHNMQSEVQRQEASIRKMKQQLTSLRQQSDNAVTVFGSDMPRLLKRIDEAQRRGGFKRKPVGPLGAFIKVKDSAWTPAVESYLGYNFLSGFAVDNAQDCNKLRAIMKEIFGNKKRTPVIYSSQFFDKVHDVSQMCVSHPTYRSIFEMTEIANPIVANCMIDQLGPECILLIPTNQEACDLLSDRRKVPRNCRRALTLEADEFFPDPNYRTYGGNVGRPKFLQVSTREAIASLEEELGVSEEELNSVKQQHRHTFEKLKRCLAQLNEVSGQVTKLRNMQLKKKTEIDRLADQLELGEPEDMTKTYAEELAVNEKKLEEQKAEETRLLAEVQELQSGLKDLDAEVKRLRNVKESKDLEVNKIKDKINHLKDEKEMFSLNNQRAAQKLVRAQKAVQQITADYEIQKRVTDRTIQDAEKEGPRIDTQRTADDIKRASNELKAKIRAVEKRSGSKENIARELSTKRTKYNKDSELAVALKKFNDEHLIRVQERNAMYKRLKKQVGNNVQNAFASILKLREYQGAMKISHSHGTVELEVTPVNTVKRATNDARTLSGGERSYSTIAFILALWECTKLPFYFLDEFDVFMDKVNRRVIMDILLNHTRDHPYSQFVFLTPLDTSIKQIDDYMTIHQLAPPERGGNNTQH